MRDNGRNVFFRGFCVFSLIVMLYLILNLSLHGTLDFEIVVMFVLYVVITIWSIVDWKLNYDKLRRQEDEIKNYKMYVKPLEELSREIRAKQHEFDNHLNAILNMHVMIDNYDELVKKQSEYINSIVEDSGRQLIPLLRISDKVLAGFLYSKIVNAGDGIDIVLQINNYEILSPVPENSIIEIVGTLVDNAIEACTEDKRIVIIRLGSENDKLVFDIMNQIDKITIGEISRFFEKGYSTKGADGRRGLGLYNARHIAERYGGSITVSREMLHGREYIDFHVVL